MTWEGVKIRHMLISPFGCNFRCRLQFGVIDISNVRMDPFERIHFVVLVSWEGGSPYCGHSSCLFFWKWGQHRPLNFHSFHRRISVGKNPPHFSFGSSISRDFTCRGAVFSTHCSRFFFIQDTGPEPTWGSYRLTLSPGGSSTDCALNFLAEWDMTHGN